MAEEAEREVPEGAAIFPLIPEELGINPLLLAVLHATVFLSGSDEQIVDADAADEAVEQMATYLRRLNVEQLRLVREDMACLATYARRQKWSKQMIRSLQTFLSDLGIGEEDKA
jgi:hypothetical protein